MSDRPVLYSFRRCPYAMRARMAVQVSGIACHIREVSLSRKPEALLAASPKGTVPVLVHPDGGVIEESIEIMRWSLKRSDPEGWLARDDPALIEAIDGSFKTHLDRYKYPKRHASDPVEHRGAGLTLLGLLEERLAAGSNLCGERRGITDAAIFPFVRQFAETDRTWFDAQPIPRLQTWLKRHISSELFVAIMIRLDPWGSRDTPIEFPAN